MLIEAQRIQFGVLQEENRVLREKLADLKERLDKVCRARDREGWGRAWEELRRVWEGLEVGSSIGGWGEEMGLGEGTGGLGE
jgi:hypothetical protein